MSHGSNITVSPAAATDADEIFNVINEAYEVETGDSGIAFKVTKRLLDPFDSGLGDAYSEMRVIKSEIKSNDTSQIVGAIVWEEMASVAVPGEKAIYFGPFAVLPTHQGRGVGRLLLNEIDRIAIAKGIKYTEISVVNHRSDLFPIYEKLGYRSVGEGKFPDLERVSRPCSFVYMQRVIPPTAL